MKKKRRKRESAAATLVILGATAALLYAVVELWPKGAMSPRVPDVATQGRMLEPRSDVAATPTASPAEESQGEEITHEERRALEDILHRRAQER